MVSGFWFVVSGLWFLVSGFWFLVSGSRAVRGLRGFNAYLANANNGPHS
jgi:hypothetical protein